MNATGKTNPNCPSPSAFHGSYRAVKKRGCICDGPGHALWAAEKERNTEARKAVRSGTHDPVKRLSGSDPTIGDLELALLLRDDLPCRETDPELFYVEGFGAAARAQERAAKSICRGCAFVEQCREVALLNGDAWAVLGATTPAERRALRRQKTETAA